MKKVKIMLSSVLVLAIVAGALAFKTKTYGQECVYARTFNGPETVCSLFRNVLTDDGIITLGTITECEDELPVTTPLTACTEQIQYTIEP